MPKPELPTAIDAFATSSGLYGMGFYHSDITPDSFRFRGEVSIYYYSIFIGLNADTSGIGTIRVQLVTEFSTSNKVVESVGDMVQQLVAWGYTPAIRYARQYKIDALLGDECGNKEVSL